MKLLEAQPEIAPGAPPEPPGETPPEQGAEERAARTCSNCGATMEPGQDWCLECGTASGGLGERAGLRSAMTVLGLTLVLVAGAVGAAFAALSKDSTTTPSQTAAAGQVAQPPPAATTAPPATTPPASTSTTPESSTSTGKSKVPKVQVPSNSAPAPAPKPAPTPSTPKATTPPASTPAPAPPATSTPSNSTPSGGGTQTTPGETTTPKPTAPVAIDIAGSAATVYDPYRRATAVGVPAKAVDGDGSTSWYVDTAPGAPQVGAGLAVNLGAARGIRSIDVTTPTPGFKLEIYATDEATAPPAITDTRWAHITDKTDVGEAGKTHIVLGAGSSKYQTLLLWITKPPAEGTRVRISELKVFGTPAG
jgi:hypothetical protein